MKHDAKIFLSQERGYTENEYLRSYNTFNFVNGKNDNNSAAGKLYVLNDDTLAPAKSLHMNVKEETMLLLLPVAGAVEYRDNNGNENIIAAGELLIAGLRNNDFFSVTNPYDSALVNFLQVWINTSFTHISTAAKEYPVDILTNQFSSIMLAAGITLHIGKFTGRQHSLLRCSASNCFAFVIEGAFELQERLLHARDGLALWQCDQIEMEALSNNAIILVIETTDHG